MRFEWMREGPAESCGDRCREWISASGAIVESTPRDFSSFAKDRDVRDAIVVLNSTGGAVAQGLELGREFRRRGVTTAISPRAHCNSMCVFLLMGGVKRYVPDEARVLVHQIWPSSNREDANAATYSAGMLVATQRMLGEIAQYVVEMGADIELFKIASRVPPWENLRPLTPDDLRRLRVHNADEIFGKLAFSGTLAGTPTSAAPAGGLATRAALGWMLVERSDQRALVRRHPLTIDGEQIGSFEILFRCAETPGVYLAEYVEKRRVQGSQAQDDRLDAVGISTEKERAILKVESSKAGEPATELVSVARGIVSAKFINALGSGSNQPLVIATSAAGKTRTTIRVGRTGLPENLPKMTAGCSQ
jgi:hypothetical protein